MSENATKIAVISDVHGNIEALTEVMADIRALNIETIINLGDCIGYGPDPERCVDILQANCTVNLCGNHDYAVLHHAEGFNPVARAAVDYVREQMRPAEDCQDPDVIRRWNFLDNLSPLYETGNYEFMHGSPRQPITEYVLPSDPEIDPFKLESIFAAMSRPYAFVGHTHYPGVVEDGGEMFLMVDDFPNGIYTLGGRKAIINVGSVGQPRDHDIRSCYVILEGDKVMWRRVSYDVEATVAKINAHPVLDEHSALRLRLGR